MTDFALQHGFGIAPHSNFRDPALFIDEDIFVYSVGARVAAYDVVKGSMTFLEKTTAICGPSEITAMARSPTSSYLAIAESSVENSSSSLSIIDLTTGKVHKKLSPRGKVTICRFAADARYLVTFGAAPDFAIAYWRIDLEKAMAVCDTKTAATQMTVHPKLSSQVAVSANGYLRFWQYNAHDKSLREFDALLPLKQEKACNFVDHCWVSLPNSSNFGNSLFVAATVNGEVSVFEGSELFLSMNVFEVLQQSVQSEKESAAASESLDVTVKFDEKLEQNANLATSIERVEPWAKGFVLGGNAGYIGIFKVEKCSEKADTKVKATNVGTFWLPDRQTIRSLNCSPEDTSMIILAFGSENVSKSSAKTDDFDFQYMPMSLKEKLGLTKLAQASATTTKPLDDTTRVHHSLFLFPISQADLAVSSGSEIFTDVFPLGLHQSPVLSLKTCVARRVVASIASDQVFKLWTYPKDSISGCFKAELTYEFSEYDHPQQMALHPLGLQVAVLFQDVLRLYHITNKELHQVWQLPTPRPNGKDVAFSACGNYLAFCCGNLIVILHVWYFVVVAQLELERHDVFECLTFSNDGNLLFAADKNGLVHGYRLFGNQNKVCEVVICQAEIGSDDEDDDDLVGMTAENQAAATKIYHDAMNDALLVLSKSGAFRVFDTRAILPHAEPDEKQINIGKDELLAELLPASDNSSFTTFALASAFDQLYIGTKNGSVLQFAWPMTDEKKNAAASTHLHSEAVTNLCFSNDLTLLISSCDAGTVIFTQIGTDTSLKATQKITDAERLFSKGKSAKNSGVLLKRLQDLLAIGPSNVTPLDDFVLLKNKTLQDRFDDISTLEKQMHTLKRDTEATLAAKDTETTETRHMVTSQLWQ